MSTVQSVERAFSILAVLSGGPLPLTDIAAQAMLPKTTVSRLLTTLEVLEAVEREQDGFNYRLGPHLEELVRPADSTARLVRLVEPHLLNLTAAVGEAAGLSVPEGYNVRTVAQAESPTPVQVRDYTGLLTPVHIIPAGLVMMADWPQEEIGRYLQRPLEAYTANSVTDPEAIQARLSEIREDGYAWVHEEFAEGISSVAAPIRDASGLAVGALTVHGPTYRFPAFGQANGIGKLVVEAAEHILISR